MLRTTYTIRLDEGMKQWILSHKNPQEFVRNILLKARFPEKAKELDTEQEKIEEKIEIECPFGTFLDSKTVHCKSHFKRVVRWLPKNRLVRPKVCQDCWINIAQPTLKFAEGEREKRLRQFESLSGSKENPESLERKEFEEKWKSLFKNGEFEYNKECQSLIRKKPGLRL